MRPGREALPGRPLAPPEPAHDPRPGQLLGAPEQYNYGTAGGVGGSSFTGRSSGAMGGTLAGSYAGRGPLGYRRPDARIADDVDHVLTVEPDVDASDVEIRVEAGDVTLTGTVTDRAARRRIEDVVVAVSGVRDVFNHVRVRAA